MHHICQLADKFFQICYLGWVKGNLHIDLQVAEINNWNDDSWYQMQFIIYNKLLDISCLCTIS